MGRSEHKPEAVRTEWLMGVKRKREHCPKCLWKSYDVLMAEGLANIVLFLFQTGRSQGHFHY